MSGSSPDQFERTILFTLLTMLICYQNEHDDVISDISLLKDKLEKAHLSSQKALEERDISKKELERALEKCDR